MPRLPASTCDAGDLPSFESTEAYVATVPHPWSYEPLPLDARNALNQATRALDEGALDEARSAATAAGYAVNALHLGPRCVVALEPKSPKALGHATLLVAADYARALVLEAPHVPEDHRSEEEAARLFDHLDAKILIVAGAHRCANTTPSGCRPNKACSGQGISAESDAAHSVTNALHAMHLALRASPSAIVQLHTNQSQTLNGDILISNGTSVALPGTFADAFYEAMKTSDLDVRGCNDPLAPPPSGAFCGETNAQGLASNGAEDACSGKASAKGSPSEHRFIHVEQSYVRMDDLDAWEPRVAQALGVAVPKLP